jgi:hypothetical protein
MGEWDDDRDNTNQDSGDETENYWFKNGKIQGRNNEVDVNQPTPHPNDRDNSQFLNDNNKGQTDKS